MRNVNSAAGPAAEHSVGVHLHLPHPGKQQCANCADPSKDRSSLSCHPRKALAPSAALRRLFDKRRAPAAARSTVPARKQIRCRDSWDSPPRAQCDPCRPAPCGSRFSRIHGLVNPVAHHIAVANRPGFARPGPNNTWVGRRHRQRADRGHRLAVKNGSPIVSTVRSLPHAARCRPRVIRARVSRNSSNGRHAIADTWPDESESEGILPSPSAPATLRKSRRSTQQDRNQCQEDNSRAVFVSAYHFCSPRIQFMS